MRGICQALPLGWFRISILSSSAKLSLPDRNSSALWYLLENSDILGGEAFPSAGHLLVFLSHVFFLLLFFIFNILVVCSRMSALDSQVQLYRKLRPKDYM